MLRIALVLLCSLSIAGCEFHGGTTVVIGGKGIRFNGLANATNVDGDTAHVEAGGHKYVISVQNGKLTVNDREYGTVTKGDFVWVSGGKVTINGHLAIPQE